MFRRVRSCISLESLMNGSRERVMCHACRASLTVASRVSSCRSCGRVFCWKCMEGGGQEELPGLCSSCFRAVRGSGEPVEKQFDGEESPLVSAKSFPESPLSRSGSSRIPQSPRPRQFPSPLATCCSSVRREEDGEDEDSGRQFLTRVSSFSRDIWDTDSISMSTGNEMYSVSSSLFDSPYREAELGDITPTSRRTASFGQDSPTYSRKLDVESAELPENTNSSIYDDLSFYRSQESQEAQQPFDYKSDEQIWYPPKPEVEEDDMETGLVDEDDETSEPGKSFRPTSFGDGAHGIKEKNNEVHKDVLKNAVQGHFRALVAQLMTEEGVSFRIEDDQEKWVQIVSSLAWQAASFVNPDTSKGGSMDPSDYLKVKCILSGSPSDSTLIKGVVCSKNVKHKRMISQHMKPRLLLFGGALEYQRVSNKLASINAVLEQEKEHLAMAVKKIEERRPNVLLVEKSVSSYAQELLSKDISLVLNIKRKLLDRISRCTGAQIASSIDNVPLAKLGQCEMFRVEKVKECSSGKDPGNKSIKTLMFFEGCPMRLGCTVLLRGTSCEELKKIKHVVQLGTFAAYHLSRETSFLADEGATLPKIPSRPLIYDPQMRQGADSFVPRACDPNTHPTIGGKNLDGSCSKPLEGIDPYSNSSSSNKDLLRTGSEEKVHDFSIKQRGSSNFFYSSPLNEPQIDAHTHRVHALERPEQGNNSEIQWHNRSDDEHNRRMELDDQRFSGTIDQRMELDDYQEFPRDYFSTADNHQILVSLSKTNTQKGTVCERWQLIRMRFYGSSDKPLGRFLREDLFDQASCCPSCKEPAVAHVRCYTHQLGSLIIRVRQLPQSEKLPGEHDGRIWMWHRCLKCKLENGVPPTTRRVVMSDAAWGLSFGKFLELSFSNHATANRVASCGHSLQRECLRFYGFGRMVAFFYYSPVDILSVYLPPLLLNFTCQNSQEWMRREAEEISKRLECLHAEVSAVLHRFERNLSTSEDVPLKMGIYRHINELKDMLKMEKNDYDVLLQPLTSENIQPSQVSVEILKLNRLRRDLLFDAYMWDWNLCSIDSHSKGNDYTSKDNPLPIDKKLTEWKFGESRKDASLANLPEENITKSSSLSASLRKSSLSEHQEEVNSQVLECNSSNAVEMDLPIESVESYVGQAGLNNERPHIAEPITVSTSLEKLPSNLSEKIDLAWTGSGRLGMDSPKGSPVDDSVRSLKLIDNPQFSKVISPVRVYSFDSATRLRHRVHAGLSPPLHLSSLKLVDSCGKFLQPNMRRAYSQRAPMGLERLNIPCIQRPVYISSPCHMNSDGARLLLPQISSDENVYVAVYDDEPTSIVSYALASKEYASFLARPPDLSEDQQSQPFRFSFDDEFSDPAEKTKFSVTCYFARQFDILRKRCCPNMMDYIASLSRCRRWGAQGGKSSAYFFKTFDERFIVKQVTKTELDSFEQFASKYFKHLEDSFSSGNPTCLAKVVGVYQVGVKSVKGGREWKIDFIVMENLFFSRKISRVYDLKGSLRSRYNPDTSGDNKVLLDLNLLEALSTKPIFVGSRAKKRLERAVWNDTSFLASIGVMDYSLLVGIDDEKKELVIGIIDYMRQYTWDKQLETWVKAAGILGGPKNTSPTVISPMQYKRRFRKAMSQYFLPVPDECSP
ncbi:putative 1-phosphatidylinositol-3-phosphate 5-kinase FAB1C [Ananas comosus]|uniref:1-phosphatidylinositol-3-phosphate 5-kinase n=1 Tax=Ananas comosus TaxID=4615 RepID=A0A6P5HLU1_ANACO|nr:putative 1-phosphatidylinositol-3-phosphate 5-kinase FAB1C [Ananas comosus]